MYEIDFTTPIHVHFIGIGGISMSGLAQILLSKGFRVSGSDNQNSKLTEELENAGATIYIGQRASNVSEDVDLAVYTAAIKEDNEEFMRFRELGIPMMPRAALLGQIMKNYKNAIAVSGTHGKTTTSSMMSEILLAAQADPTLTIGGIAKSINGNLRLGNSDVFLTEACEYTNSFLSFFPRYGIILNIEEDHMDFFKDIEDIRNSFHNFARLLPEDGALVINNDIPDHKELTSDLKCNVKTFGFDDSADYYCTNLEVREMGNHSFMFHTPDGKSCEVVLDMLGRHNVSNAISALALADILGIDLDLASKALSICTGARRRFEKKGMLGGVTVIDDYAHHPTEIRATLQAAKAYPHREVWCVFQPHTYTRTKAFLNDFAEALSMADHVVLTDIYAAREKNTIGISSKDLQALLLEKGCDCHYFASFSDIENFLLQNCIPRDMLITMGAGDVVKIGENLLGQ
ncbi:MAG: UDP-N-acetylmuramate--L-alanine ligase [Lachnospiraceae bacterium]|nr:UDP-N-acetylmuramate--L-alanine ligase [Lachnospiraceae bacterium]